MPSKKERKSPAATPLAQPPPGGTVWAAIERERMALNWSARRFDREAEVTEGHYTLVSTRGNWDSVEAGLRDAFVGALVKAGVPVERFAVVGEMAAHITPIRTYTSARLESREARLSSVREALLKKYPQTEVAEAIGESEFLDGLNGSELEVYQALEEVILLKRKAIAGTLITIPQPDHPKVPPPVGDFDKLMGRGNKKKPKGER